jgi:4-amino-4-deoxy-L-arabinose transferase-like glycosyltransferase
VLANGRLATLDVGLTAFIFVAFYYFWRYLERPTRLSFVLAAVGFTLAQLSKFPAVLLVPVFFVLVLMKGHSLKAFGAMLLLSIVAVSLFYGVNMWNMPLEVQHGLIEASIQDGSGSYTWLASFLRWILHGLADIAPLRPCSQYLLGLFMDGGHAFGGHTIYFLGEVGSHFWLYYPVVFLIKEPLASQAFLVVAVALALRRRARPGPLIVGVMAFCLLYLAIFTGFGAQLGIRYILPVFPFLYMLVAGQAAKLRGRPGLLGVSLLVWLAVSSLLVFPSYLAYYNELVGGPRNGYLYLGDSNTDWGQDLRRLTGFVEERGITAIRVSYFGGGDPAYYLGARYVPWDFASGPSGGWFAVSASLYEGRSADYAWLAGYTPVAQIGYSILVYNIPA